MNGIRAQVPSTLNPDDGSVLENKRNILNFFSLKGTTGHFCCAFLRIVSAVFLFPILSTCWVVAHLCGKVICCTEPRKQGVMQ